MEKLRLREAHRGSGGRRLTEALVCQQTEQATSPSPRRPSLWGEAHLPCRLANPQPCQDLACSHRLQSMSHLPTAHLHMAPRVVCRQGLGEKEGSGWGMLPPNPCNCKEDTEPFPGDCLAPGRRSCVTWSK